MRNIIGILLIVASVAGLVYIDNETKIFSSKLERFFPKEELVTENTMLFQNPTDAPIIDIPPTSASVLSISKKEFIRHHVVLFTYVLQKTRVRFFIIKEGIREHTKYRAVFDACSLCYTKYKGFDYKNKYFICRDCSMQFHSERVGIASGGCNPIHLKIVADDTNLYISKENLAKALPLF